MERASGRPALNDVDVTAKVLLDTETAAFVRLAFPGKRPNVVEVMRQKIARGDVRDTWHSEFESRATRRITLLECIRAIQNGQHEPSKDRYHEHFKDDFVRFRTAIDLDAKDEE